MKWPSLSPSLRILVTLSAVAIVCGGLAFWGSQRYLAEYSASVEHKWKTRYAPTRVIVAARDLEAGRILETADLASREMPAAFIPSGIWKPDQANVLLGRALLVDLSRGDPLTQSALVDHDGRALAARLRPGARAITVPVDDVSSQAGLVRPGDRVDLLLAEEVTQGAERCVSVRPLLEALTVMATGRRQSAQLGFESSNDRSYSTITLDVLPDQAQRLTAALRVGELIPMLRGTRDEASVDLKAIALGQRGCGSASRGSVMANGNDSAADHRVGIDVMIGGDRELTRTRHWVSKREP